MADSVQQKLFDAAFQLNLNAVKKHLKAGASLKKSDKDGCDALYNAVSCLPQNDAPGTAEKQKQLVEFLLNEGADVEKRYKFVSGWTPLMLAASSGHSGALEALIAAGADVEAADDYKYTPLMRAKLNKHSAVVKMLIAAGAKNTVKPDKRSNPKKKNPIPNTAGTSKTLKAMEKNFAPHKVPPLLAALCNYWDKRPEFFAGSFEVDGGQADSLKAWFQGNEAGWSQIRIFGIDGIHSLYGVWFKDGKASHDAPVIYLGGEGEGTTVMASTWEEFLSILASNREWEPFDKKFFDPEADNESENAAFCEWLREKFGILPAKNPGAILAKAKKQHADFGKWLATVKKAG